MEPQYSIIIPVLNSKATLNHTLRCLDAQTFSKTEFECIVVDDGSTDGAGEWLKDYHSDLSIRVVSHASTLGRSSSRNTGWRAARGAVVIFLDADMLPVPHWLASYDQAFASTNADVISGARYHSDRFIVESLSGDLGQHPSRLYAALEMQVQAVMQTHPDSILCAFSVLGSNLAIRRLWLDRADGFNPFFTRFEDIELGLRLWEANVRFAYAEEAIAYHCPNEPFDPQDAWFTAEEMIALFYRHPYRLVLLSGFWGAQMLQASESGDGETLSAMVERAHESAGVSLQEEFVSYYKMPLPVDCRWTIEQVTEIYVSRHLVTEPIARQHLLEVIPRGLYTEIGQGELLLDIHHTMNWQGSCYCSPFRNITRMIAWRNRRRTPFQQSLDPRDAISYQCRGSYEITLPAPLLHEYGGEARINIALPVEHASQTHVRITHCCPDDLLQEADHGQGMIFRFPIHAGSEPLIKIGYAFECQLHEFVPPSKGDFPALGPLEKSGYLHSTLPSAYLGIAQTILAQVVPDFTMDAYARAQAIYTWAWENFEFMEVPFPYFYLLRTGFGACIQRMKLCLNLMRLAGIPAREQCGVFFERGAHQEGPQTVVQRTYGSGPFIHTWVEFYAAGHGWVPLNEFESAVRIQSVAISDDHDRKTVREASSTRCHTLFGSLDPFRLYGSDQGNRIPTYPLVRSKQGWQPQPEITSQTAHGVQATLWPM